MCTLFAKLINDLAVWFGCMGVDQL